MLLFPFGIAHSLATDLIRGVVQKYLPTL